MAYHPIRNFYLQLIDFGTKLQPFLLLALRLYWGLGFFQSGIGKLQDIAKTREFFASIEIPFPLFNAYLVGCIETIGGIALFFGLAARLLSLPLIAVMCGALATAHFGELIKIFSHSDVFTVASPLTFLIVALVVFAFGPGAFSLDGLLKRYVFKEKATKR